MVQFAPFFINFRALHIYNMHEMKLESVGVLINLQPLGERDSVARIFTADFGVLCGLLRGAQVARKNKPLVGQVGAVSWNARLDSQLGVFHWDAEKNLAASLMMRYKPLEYMNSAFALLATLLPEREQYQKLYNDTLILLQNLMCDSCDDVYLNWEISLLRELGYALNLLSCSGCGTHDNLEYLSPRTGRAVCSNCAIPYIDKLYKLPLNLDVTCRFLERACMTQGVDLPSVRKMLVRGVK